MGGGYNLFYFKNKSFCVVLVNCNNPVSIKLFKNLKKIFPTQTFEQKYTTE